MILYFIRHGQSENNALDPTPDGLARRRADPLLTGIGKKQAALLGEFLGHGTPAGGSLAHPNGSPGFGITHIYTSLMVRAVHTAVAVAETLDLPVFGTADIHEFGGIYLDDEGTGKPITLAGMSKSYFLKEFPRCVLPEDIHPEGWWASRPFESREECRERACRVLDWLLDQHAGKPDRVVLISHADFYNEFLRGVMKIPENEPLWFTIHNTGITRVDFRENERRVVYMNRTTHLPPELLTA